MTIADEFRSRNFSESSAVLGALWMGADSWVI